MRILNRSSEPTSEIRRILRRELARAHPGTVYVLDRPFGSDRQGHVRYSDRRVRIWIGGTTDYPYASTYGGPRGGELAGFPRVTVRDWREDLIATAAHEAEHLRAHDRGDPDDELAAERHALARIRSHRGQAERRRGLLGRILAAIG